jgi:geranylgeranyl pyrophosphate synthase
VEGRISSRFESDSAVLSEVSSYLLALGGKRIRPILALSSARLFGMPKPSTDLIDAAAGIELIHMATLLHDDIIDQSPLRRHQTSPYFKFGLPSTLLAGDFLLARAFGLCAHLDEFIVRATETACVELTEGEIMEGTLSPETPRSLESYITVVEKKTASLFVLAAAVGSHLAGATDDDVSLMQSFGQNAGITFQMVDDILDVTAEQDLLGKPTGTDLKQKTPSLINLLWINSTDKRALDYLAQEFISEAEARELALSLRKSPIVSEAKALAKSYADRAKNNLTELSSPALASDVRESLFALVDYTLERLN